MYIPVLIMINIQCHDIVLVVHTTRDRDAHVHVLGRRQNFRDVQLYRPAPAMSKRWGPGPLSIKLTMVNIVDHADMPPWMTRNPGWRHAFFSVSQIMIQSQKSVSPVSEGHPHFLIGFRLRAGTTLLFENPPFLSLPLSLPSSCAAELFFRTMVPVLGSYLRV